MTNKEVEDKIKSIVGEGNYVYVSQHGEEFDPDKKEIQLDGWFTVNDLTNIAMLLNGD